MFRKKDDELLVPTPEAAQHEETAYEDNWYRSLKAMREQQEPDEPQAGEDDTDPADGSPAGSSTAETATDETATDEKGDASSGDLEERAGQLLERLRTLQHLADEEPDPKPEQRSVSG